MKHQKTLSLAILSIAVTTNAEYVRHFDDITLFSDVPNLLDQVGIGQNDISSETIYETFTTPSNTSSLTFDFIRDTGSYKFSFGVFDVTNNPYNPITQKEEWGTYSIANSTLIFDDKTENPGISNTITVGGDIQLAFYIIPNNTYSHFNIKPHHFYPSQTYDSNHRSPLFSISDANPGELDQMLSFSDYTSGITLFSFEDLTRTGSSDEDFTDMAFTISPSLIPTPSDQQNNNGIVDDDFQGGAQAPLPSTLWLAIPLTLLMLNRPSKNTLQHIADYHE